MIALFHNSALRYVFRNHRKFLTYSLTVSIVIMMTMMITTTGLANALTEEKSRFVAGLTGNQETRPVETNASGSVSLIPMKSDKILYKLNVTDIENVTNAEIDLGKQDQNGTVIVTLFRSGSPSSQVKGLFAQGNITSSNLRGPLEGKQLAELVRIMSNGNTYVNVRTRYNPSGEVRGQIGLEGIDESGTMLGENKEKSQPLETEVG
jgi:CHRD domain